MKVLQIIDVYKHGGAEKVFDAYREFCKNESIEIESVSMYKSENEKLAFLQETNAHGIWGKLFQQICALSKFRKMIKECGIEKIVSFLDRSNILSIMASSRKIPVVVTVHNPPTVQYQKLGKLKHGVFFLLRYFYNKKNVSVIAVSNQVKESLESIGVRKVKIVYNPLLAPSLTDVKIPFELSKPYFVFVGRLSYQKAPWKLIKGFAYFHHTSKKNIHLVIVGDGELRTELEKLSEDSQTQNFVHFTGFVKNPMEIIRNAYCMIFSSYYEGFPITVLESFLCDVPVIGSRVALPKEIREQLPFDDFYYDNTELTENFDAMVYGPDDCRLAEILEKAFVEKEKVKKIASAGNKWVRENCSIDNFKLYE
ncbi:MAG: glycosyltransferase [Treponema sp.]|nr:glycosyltransferase [Treponema sp.]